MRKELLTIEFRYLDAPKFEHDTTWKSKTITIGVFDTLEEAISEGNKVLSVLSKTFEVRAEDRFGLNNGSFGSSKRLVTNCCYPTNGVQYFAKITPLKYDNLNETVEESFKAFEKYKKYKHSE